jgi:hypothetical protein
MKWVDDGYVMKWFSIEKRSNVEQYCTELNLYNIRSGNIFCRLTIYHDGSYKIETLDFFNDIKDQLHRIIVNNLVSEEPYSYNKWILPLFRELRLNEIGI